MDDDDLTNTSLMFLLSEYVACDRAMDYGFDPETNEYRTEIIHELVRRIDGELPPPDEELDSDD